VWWIVASLGPLTLAPGASFGLCQSRFCGGLLRRLAPCSSGYGLGFRRSVLPGAPGSALCSLGARLPQKYLFIDCCIPKKILHKQLSSGHGLRSRRSVWHGASDPALCSLSVWLPPKIFFWWIVVLCFWPRLWDLALKIMKIGFGHRLYSPSFQDPTLCPLCAQHWLKIMSKIMFFGGL